ncbi:SDR family NAD(P)-dependent oxidoreductase [Cohnella nanjingensis]|uniref:SDR family NAD(P)-dependent oxidoreductase n=1 Tax=Cohnella nanjingensis TaxID=1387779 RepID=A0A7X0VCX9_9BACL|nr:SDR family NAD(P)-dependent oxidoreductase [Cohnella nanjingensis]MBB6669397.1 SDR family NAD(P)-dependent oxidoreductase [Cohnella nanjingensis]
MFENTVILVTGGTGSWGQELVKELLLQNPQKLIIFSRNETSQVMMKREMKDPRISYCIGDVREREALVKACEGVDYIFHLAALKHVTICERQPLEALKTNVTGTKNVIEAAIENRVKKVINISTDKAADPVNIYGFTKAIGEKLIVEANMHKAETRFVNVRGGNILGSNGSVLRLFIKQLEEQRQLSITDKKMVRYFMTLQSATELLLTAAKEGKGGETFIPMMPSCKILDLAEVLKEAYGMKDAEIAEIGCGPGEKIKEVLLSPFEAQNSVILNNRYVVVLPTLEIPALKGAYSACPSVPPEISHSESLMAKTEIKQMLIDGGFWPEETDQ